VQENLFLGVIVTVLSGLVMGTSAWPLKLMRRFKYEHFGLVSMAFSLLVLPWAITLAMCPDALSAYRSVPLGLLLKSNLFSLAWGAAQVLALLCFVRIGVNQVMVILGGQLLGFSSGEWRGVTGSPRRQICLAIVILVLSMVVLALGNGLATSPPIQSEHSPTAGSTWSAKCAKSTLPRSQV
jgi:hypothetical protein